MATQEPTNGCPAKLLVASWADDPRAARPTPTAATNATINVAEIKTRDMAVPFFAPAVP
jgi:hypothetical protein